MFKPIILIIFISFFSGLIQAQTISDSAIIINEIQINGNRTTKDYVILREMSIKVGDTLTQKAMELDRNNIYNLGLFNKVDVENTIQQNRATIVVTVSERWYFIPYPIVGIKYRDPTKWYYGAGIANTNFRGRNEKLFANVAFGYDRWFSVNYQDPKWTDDDVFIGLGLTLQNIHNLSSSSGEYMNTNIFLNGTIGKRFGMYQTLSGNFSYEVWQVDNPKLNRTISASGRDAFLTASIQYRYDTRNDREYTTDGSLVSLFFAKSGFGESEMNLSAFDFDLRKFFGFNKGSGFGLRSMGTFQWGGIIPPYRHIFFGYDQRIRGYFYDVIESENHIGASAELRLPILLPRYLEIYAFGIPEFQKLRYGLYFGIFTDVGKAWSRNQVLADQPWYSGVGAGFQFLFPYGFTIRTEAAVNNLGIGEYLIDFDTSF